MEEIKIRYEGKPIGIRSGETVLEGLERAGMSVPSSCRAGACQFCMLKAVEGPIPKNAQQGLKPQLRASGHFLACICKPTGPIECLPAHTADFRGTVSIEEIRPIGPGVVQIRFERPEDFDFTPGQFVTLTLEDRVSRSYSIASQSEVSDYFDIHVRRVDHGRMSVWFHDTAKCGDTLWMEGPKGECTYYPGTPDEPMTLIGTGTGIAPLYAIMEDALRKGHTGPITLYQGAVCQENLYFEDEIGTLAQKYPNVRYVKCVLKKHSREDITYGDLKEIAAEELTEARIRRIYLCGDPGLVRLLKKTFFLAGVSIKRIHADPFVISAPVKQAQT